MVPPPEAPPDTNGKPRRTLMGAVNEGAARARDRRARAGPPSWIVLKLAVFITLTIIGYTCYVYIGRLCVPMVRRSAGALGSRALGIAFLVVFSLFSIMILWSYFKICTIAPGFAREHVQNSEPPPNVRHPTWDEVTDSYDGDALVTSGPYEFRPDQESGHAPQFAAPAQSQPILQAPHASAAAASSPRSDQSVRNLPLSTSPPVHGTGVATAAGEKPVSVRRPSGASARRPSLGPAVPSPPIIAPSPSLAPQHPAPASIPPPATVAAADAATHDRNVGVTDTLSAAAPNWLHPNGLPPPVQQSGLNGQPPPYTRRPPQAPVLRPEYRYCQRDGHVKPLRAHHCRMCGTCVLRYDHHCPWIGQCVGGRNHRFFVIFLFWALLFCLWVFCTVIGLNASSKDGNRDIDPQHIVIIALSGLFSIFTSALLATHCQMISLNLTTVESLSVSDMRDREKAGLSRTFSWHQFRAKAQARREWDRDWGRLGREGNIWWLGSARRNWESVMGKRPIGWILPLGGPVMDGVQYELNPRFDEDGRWLPRSWWPEHLR